MSEMSARTLAQPFIHPTALCSSTQIGPGTRIWAFTNVLGGARLGADCNICDGVFIENDVLIGDRVTVKCGVQLWDGIVLESDVFVGPNATFTNDRYPRSKQYPDTFAKTVVRRGASIGANATILPGVVIGAGAMIGAGAVVTRSVPPNAVVTGNPGRITGYVGTDQQKALPSVSPLPESDDERVVPIGVGGATIHRLRTVKDLRGSLSVGEFEREIPFVPQRYFMIFDVPSREIRGEHAHKLCQQFLICTRGSCGVLLDDGKNRREFTLDRLDIGINMPGMVWGTQFRYSKDAVLLVFASHHYDPDDYIRDYDEFRRLVPHEPRP